jgi:hypothetical protein
MNLTDKIIATLPRKLSAKQSKVLAIVVNNPGQNTASIATYFGSRSQSYDTYTRDRLITLEQKGLVKQQVKQVNGRVVERVWYPADSSDYVTSQLKR